MLCYSVIPSEVEGSRGVTIGCFAGFLDYASLRSE
jgi:hypothetical protein